MEASSPIRTLVAASSVTSSIMLLATPRAHDGVPGRGDRDEPHPEGRRLPRCGVAGEQLEGPRARGRTASVTL